MRRRTLLLGTLVAPLGGRVFAADPVARIGVLLFSSPATDPNLPAFVKGLRQLGYEEGHTIALDHRFAEGRPERLPALAAELAAARPNLLVAFGGDVAKAAVPALGPVPMVMLTSNDPVRAGLIANLGRPGGNITGVTLLAAELAAKRIELVKELLPRTRRVGLLLNPEHEDDDLAETDRATRSLGLELIPLELRRPGEIEGILSAAAAARPDALVVVASRLTNLLAPRILVVAADQRWPVIGGWGRWAQQGALAAYGPSIDESVRQLARFADKILKGASPADLPVEQPSRIDLTINLKTARQLGVAAPASLLARADEVIE